MSQDPTDDVQVIPSTDLGQAVGIVTDSSCDLPRRLIERFKIGVAPLIVRFGPEEYEDGELSTDEF